jgi:hypothetical protein
MFQLRKLDVVGTVRVDARSRADRNGQEGIAHERTGQEGIAHERTGQEGIAHERLSRS